MCAFDLPTGEIRKDFQEKLYEENVIILICGDCSLRFRPHLNVHKKICNLH
jgi:L-lysine 6-transaminase